ncbi:MAG: hypothetical protein AAFV25_27100, partial [Bacteroidota bacterium]
MSVTFVPSETFEGGCPVKALQIYRFWMKIYCTVVDELRILFAAVLFERCPILGVRAVHQKESMGTCHGSALR